MECSLPVNLTNAAYFVAVNNIMYLNLTTIQNMLGITSTTPTPNATFIVPLNKSCIEEYQDEVNSNFYTLLTLSIIILIILSLCQPRLNLWPRCCWKRPGLVVPVNLIHSSPQRLIYVCIFGAMTSRLLLLILGFDVYPTPTFLENISDPLWSKTLTTFINVFFQAMLFFPIFACVNSRIPLMGYIIGLIYTTYSWSHEIQVFGLFLRTCLDTEEEDVITQYVLFSVTGLPTVMFLLIVIIWYIWKIFETFLKLCLNRTQWKSIILHHDQSTYYESHVKYLLQQHPKTEYNNVIIKYIVKIISYYYAPEAGMQYPVGFLSAIVVMATILYQLTASTIYFSTQFTAPLHNLREIYSNVDDIVGVAINNTDIMGSLLTSIDDTIIMLNVFFVAGPLIAFIFNSVLLLHFIAVARNHMMKLAKGDYSFFPTKRSKPSLRLLNAMRYASYQIGYFVWAWIILCLVSWVIGLITVVLYWLIKYALGETINIFIWLAFPLIFSLIVYLFQWISCIFLFNKKTNHKHTIIRNSRLFHWYTYALFFYNVVLGLLSSMLRIFYSIGFGLLLLFRLDRVVLMKGFESYDTGHQLYIGYLYLDHTQNNPVIHVFIKLLIKAIKKNATDLSEIELDNDSSDEYPRVSTRALTRWKVAYTLIRNPQLQQLTATFLTNNKLQSFKSKSHCSEGLEPILQSPDKQDVESNVWSSSDTETNNNFRLKPIPSSTGNQDIEAKPLKLVSPLTSQTETNIHDLGLEPKSLLKPENESDDQVST